MAQALDIHTALATDRAWSTLTVKSMDGEQRTIEGVASTPTVDRMGDIVDPMGAIFNVPMPLLWQHKHDQPVGHVTFAKSKHDGIQIKAKIVRIDEPGELKNLVDKAWQAVKHGLVKGLSIGFKPLEDGVQLLNTGGFRFNKWSWYELSLVTVPANNEATITIVKSLDKAALGIGVQDSTSPGGTGKPKSTTSIRSVEGMTRKALSEQTSEYAAARAAKAARQAELMETANERGETLDEAEAQEYDELGGEIKSIDAHLKRLDDLEKHNAAMAKPVTAGNGADGAANRNPGSIVRVSGPQLEKGIAFARVVRCLGLAQGNRAEATQIAAQMYQDDPRISGMLKAATMAGSVASDLIFDVIKAGVPAATTTDNTWAKPLVPAEITGIAADFVEFLRPMTILGKFGTGGIPALRRIPFRTPIVGQTTGGLGYWVGEAKAKPLTQFAFSRTSLTPLKVANISVSTEELLRDSSPSADILIRNGLAEALQARLDTDFISPSKAAVAGVSPASITNGITPIDAGKGKDGDAVRTGIRLIMQSFLAANNPPTSGVWIMSNQTALALSLLTNTLGQPEFPGITMTGGTFAGLPVITSEYVPLSGSPGGGMVVLVNAGDVFLADEGGVAVDMSREASLQMDGAPTMQAAGSGSPQVPVPTTVVSMFQTNSVAFRAERTINWALRRTSGVRWLNTVIWGT
jgi:HK97 family phage major capsid protein/HK97 family phage prohead protease